MLKYEFHPIKRMIRSTDITDITDRVYSLLSFFLEQLSKEGSRHSFEERMGFSLGEESSGSRWIHECRVEP